MKKASQRHVCMREITSILNKSTSRLFKLVFKFRISEKLVLNYVLKKAILSSFDVTQLEKPID